MTNDLFQLLQSIQHELQEQSKKLATFEQKLQTFSSELTALKSKPMTVEYKFDQLKVETLEGTLNIGLQPYQSPTSIDQFSIPQQKQPIAPTMQPHFDRELYDEMILYLDTTGPARISSLEVEHGRNVNESYQKFMIDDIKRQMNMRIPYYLNLFVNSEQTSERMDTTALKQTIIQKMKEDIDAAFLAFILTLPSSDQGDD
ncbi:MAG: spore germination protein GerPC [Bacilli bacterium]